MPTVAMEGQLKFVVHTKENAFEPPHVHVRIGNNDECRIELNGARFMDEPPVGLKRQIRDAYVRHAVVIRQVWDEIHRR